MSCMGNSCYFDLFRARRIEKEQDFFIMGSTSEGKNRTEKEGDRCIALMY